MRQGVEDDHRDKNLDMNNHRYCIDFNINFIRN